MKFIKIDRQSIAFRLTSLTIIIIIGQAILLSLFLIIGGVLSQAEKNAFDSFDEKVSNRKDYLQREMKYHWTNMNPYMQQIAALYDETETDDQFLEAISESMISMLRATQTTGVFLILNDETREKSALYIRDYDPILNDYDNSDLFMVYGPSSLSKKLRIPLDQMWKKKISLDTINSDFYEKPLSKSALSTDSNLLGYWSLPFQLSPKDGAIITYSMPLFDAKKNIIGIIGVEVSKQYLMKFLPATDLQNKDSYGYMIGYRQSETSKLQTILLMKEIQKRMVSQGDFIEYQQVNIHEPVYILKNGHTEWNIYLAVENLGLYKYNTPFEQNQWYLIGIMNENHLLGYVLRIQHILLVAFIASVIVGAMAAYFISHKFTEPIVNVAKKVKQTTQLKEMELENTGLTEVDELLEAIQVTSNMLVQASGKTSQIIEMVGLPLGVFEYTEQGEHVFITDQMPKLLSIEVAEAEKLIQSKELFISMIQRLLDQPEEGEEDIYFVDSVPVKWLKIKYTKKDDSTIGVILDMTEEMAEKKKILTDRDIDSLTGIYNRKAMQIHMEERIRKRNPKCHTALLMFDLDNLKGINDTYGHLWGDAYIKKAVEHLARISEQQIVGRRSGDEFTLLLIDFDEKAAVRQRLDRFFLNLSLDEMIFSDGYRKAVSISAGLVWIEGDELSFDEYLHQADELLYKAKRNNKGYYCE